MASILALQHPNIIISELNPTISRLDTSIASSCKLLTMILECHSNVYEIKFNRLYDELPKFYGSNIYNAP